MKNRLIKLKKLEFKSKSHFDFSKKKKKVYFNRLQISFHEKSYKLAKNDGRK